MRIGAATSGCARRIRVVSLRDDYAFVIKKLFYHLGEKKFMFKKKDIAIAIALAMTVSQPVIGQGEPGEVSASSTAAPAASGPAAAAVPEELESYHCATIMHL